MEQSDEVLVLACRQGDAAAWEALLLRYQRLVYSIPRRAGLNDDLSAEVFQRVFARLVEHLDRLEQPERIGAWLATTARREAWRLSKREGSTVPLPTDGADDEGDADIPDTALLPDEVLLRMEQQQLVRRAVAGLEERCRTLITLLFYQNEPPAYTDIAATLGISVGSIGPTRARCLQKLRQQLDGMGF